MQKIGKRGNCPLPRPLPPLRCCRVECSPCAPSPAWLSTALLWRALSLSLCVGTGSGVLVSGPSSLSTEQLPNHGSLGESVGRPLMVTLPSFKPRLARLSLRMELTRQNSLLSSWGVPTLALRHAPCSKQPRCHSSRLGTRVQPELVSQLSFSTTTLQ